MPGPHPFETFVAAFGCNELLRMRGNNVSSGASCVINMP